VGEGGERKKKKEQKGSGDKRSKKTSKTWGVKNPNGDEQRRKTKKKVFTIWQLNSLTPIGWQLKWIWLPPLDSDQNGFGCCH